MRTGAQWVTARSGAAQCIEQPLMAAKTRAATLAYPSGGGGGGGAGFLQRPQSVSAGVHGLGHRQPHLAKGSGAKLAA